MKKNNLLKIFSFVIGLIFVFNVINISFANNLSENPVPLLDGFAQISKGIDFTLALDTDGKLYAWGDNYAGQFGDGTLIGSTIPKQIGTSIYSKISAGGYHSLALKADGTLWVWGYNANGRLGDNSTTSSIIPKQINGHIFSQISAGDNHSLALKEDGEKIDTLFDDETVFIYYTQKNNIGELDTTKEFYLKSCESIIKKYSKKIMVSKISVELLKMVD